MPSIAVAHLAPGDVIQEGQPIRAGVVGRVVNHGAPTFSRQVFYRDLARSRLVDPNTRVSVVRA